MNTIFKPKATAANDVADMLVYFPQGATVRDLVDKYRDILFDAGVTDDAHAIQLVSKKLSSRAEQGLVTRKQGTQGNMWIYYPLGGDANVAAPVTVGIELADDEREDPSLPENLDPSIAAAAWQQTLLESAAADADAAKAGTLETHLLKTFGPRLDCQMAVLQSIIQDAWWDGHEKGMREGPDLEDADHHINALGTIAEALKLIRPEWAATICVVRAHLLDLAIPH